MWQVGDEATHARFLAALGSGHGYEGRVEAWYNGERIADDLTFESGRVIVTARNRERRNLRDLHVRESLFPSEPADPFSPYGTWIKAFVTVTAGMTRFPEIPVFAGKAMVADGRRWSGATSIQAADPMWQVNREAFEEIRPAPSGLSIPDAILMLLREVFPGATLDDQTGSTAIVPAGLMWSAGRYSRGRALDDLAAAVGAELYARPTEVWPGLDAVLRPVPSLTDAVAWTLPDGDESIVVADQRTLSGASVVNRWIVTVERQDQTPFSVVITDDNPVSPTRYGGPMGKLPEFLTSPLISSSDQAYAAGLAKLARSIGLARPRTVTVPSNPALEGGDILAIGVDGEFPTRHISDEFSVPLQYDPASMDIATRSTGAEL